MAYVLANVCTVLMSEFPWLVDGSLLAEGPRAVVLDPATGLPVGSFAIASTDVVDRAVAAAERAFPAWAADPLGRRNAMLAAADVVAGAHAELARLLTFEQGKPIVQAGREVDRFARWLRYYASLELPPETLRDDNERSIVVTRRPLGVVAALMPWNFPVSLFGWKLAPALAAGNTMVARPSMSTPLTTLRLGALLQSTFPPGVLNIIAGRADTARRLVAHPTVRKIAFTGSTETGREIMAAAGPMLKRVTLELGGNDAAIVLDDVGLDAIEERLFWAAFYNSGQVCMAVKRLLVPNQMRDEVVERLAARATRSVIGHGLDPATELGPLQNEAQRDRVAQLVRSARTSGATIASGGDRVGDIGWFYQPTIVSDVAPDHPLVAEEQFGPALPVIGYDTLDAAVRMASTSRYGLGLSLWTGDPARATEIADRLAVGTVWINQHQEVLPEMPFGGANDSGIGYEGGHPGLDSYMQLRVTNTWRA